MSTLHQLLPFNVVYFLRYHGTQRYCTSYFELTLSRTSLIHKYSTPTPTIQYCLIFLTYHGRQQYSSSYFELTLFRTVRDDVIVYEIASVSGIL